MEEGKDYDQNFSPTPDIVIVCIITSRTPTNDLEFHSIDIEQTFLQTDKLLEAMTNILSTRLPVAQMLTTKILCMKYCVCLCDRSDPTQNHGCLLQE